MLLSQTVRGNCFKSRVRCRGMPAWMPPSPFVPIEHHREIAPRPEWSYGTLWTKVKEGDVWTVQTDREYHTALVESKEGEVYRVGLPSDFSVQWLLENHVDVFIRPLNRLETPSWLESLESLGGIGTLFFQMILLGMVLQLAWSRGGSMGETVGGEWDDDVSIGFDAVAGLSGPKKEWMELVSFLKDPAPYKAIGAEIPKGVLMYGPPGTGKTLLARAVAGEAGVPFLYCSGSEFVQMFVGLGASRIRSLFKRAREKAPCIVYIDEIDAIGRSRSSGDATGAHSENEQTLNQLLTELDGFQPSSGIMVVASTNRLDVLDEALTRSGRFDRHIYVGRPTTNERLDILRLYTQGVDVAEEVSLEDLARKTSGMVGADLKNLVNEAKMVAVGLGETQLTRRALETSLDKMIFGVENSTVSMTPSELEVVAYHEAGHALMGIVVAGPYDRLDRITVVPRGDAGGMTVFLPEASDVPLYSQAYLMNRMVVALGGRVAEQHIYGSLNTTTGAAGDLEEVQREARRMVSLFGFNETLGQASWSDAFPISGGTAESIDDEIRLLVDWAYREARMKIEHYEFYLHRLAEGLLQKKTLSGPDLIKCVEGITCELPTKASR